METNISQFDNIKTPEELYKFMRQNIKYGFYSALNRQVYSRRELNNDKLYEELLFNTYYLQTPEELLINKYGICYDQVELERKWFEDHGYQVITYYTPFHNHAFLIYSDGIVYGLFETTIKRLNGIYVNSDLKVLINQYKNMQLTGNDIANIDLYKYDKVNFGCDIYNFIDFITKENKLGTKLKQKGLNYNNIKF